MMNAITPSIVNPLALPSLPLAERRNLPNVSAIYFALSSKGEVLYVGKLLTLSSEGQHTIDILS